MEYINGSTPIKSIFKGSNLVYQVEESSGDESIVLTFNSLPQGFNIGGYTETATTANSIDNGDGTYTYTTTLEEMGWTTVKPTSYQQSFANSSLIKLNNLPFSSSITNTNMMFYNCVSLNEINAKGWNVSNVTSYIYMLDGCTSLNKLILGSVSQSTYDWWYSRLTDAGIQNNVTIEYTIV